MNLSKPDVTQDASRFQRLNRASVWLAAVAAIGSVLNSGCARQEDPPAAPKTAGGVVATPTTANWDLTGIWLGLPTLDEARLDAQLAQLDVAGQTALLEQAQVFLSTTIAVEYRADGSLQKEVELVSLDNQVLSDSATGTWKLISNSGQSATIDVAETASDGSVIKEQVALEVDVRGDRFELAAPVGRDLTQCGARLVFERQNLGAVNVAAEPMESTLESR